MELEQAILAPEILPDASDGLIQAARKWHRGLQKVVVSLYVSRQQYRVLNTIKIHAQPDTPPTESAEAIARAIMVVAQTHFEETDLPATYRAQFYIAPKSTNDVVRKSCHFDLGEGALVGDVPDPTRMDDLMIQHINACHGKILDQAEKIAELGRIALEQVGQSFVRTNEALEAKADAIMTANTARFEQVQQEQRSKTTREVIDILRGAANEAARQFAAHRAAQADGSVVQVLPAGSPAPQSPVASAALAGAQALLGTGEPVLIPSQLPPPQPAQTAPAPAPVPTSSPNEEEIKEAHAYVARTFGETLLHDQWFTIIETLTKAQIQSLKKATSAQTDAVALEAVAELRDTMKPAQQSKLLQTLHPEQQTMILSLLTAAPQPESQAGDDDD